MDRIVNFDQLNNMSLKQNDKLNEQLQETECERCGGNQLEHRCCDCEAYISEKTCKEYEGYCYQCMWLLSK